MHRLYKATGFVLLALAAGGCACNRSFVSCEGPRCEYEGGPAGCGIEAPCGDCADCGAAPCGDCGPGPCSCADALPDCQSCADPLFTLNGRNLLHAIFGCTGCDGEVYWSEWFSDPPDCCDPCDDYGHWIGRGLKPVGYASMAPSLGPVVDGPVVEGTVVEGTVVEGPVVETASSGCPCGRH